MTTQHQSTNYETFLRHEPEIKAYLETKYGPIYAIRYDGVAGEARREGHAPLIIDHDVRDWIEQRANTPV